MRQLKMELAGYQSCCKRLGDDLAAKDQELEGQLMLCPGRTALQCFLSGLQTVALLLHKE